MKKYMVFAYTNINKQHPSSKPSNEERQIIFKKWMDWQEELGELLVSMGSPLLKGKVINSTGVLEKAVSDISGYMIIKAQDTNHAIELLNRSPLFDNEDEQKYELFECMM